VRDPAKDGHDRRRAEVAGGGLGATNCDPRVGLEAVEAAFNPAAKSSKKAVDEEPRETVALHGDDRLGAARPWALADGIAVRALVGNRHPRLQSRLIDHRAEALGVGRIAGRRVEGDAEPETVGAKVDRGREATTRTADIVARRARSESTLFATAECSRTHMMVLSIIWRLA